MKSPWSSAGRRGYAAQALRLLALWLTLAVGHAAPGNDSLSEGLSRFEAGKYAEAAAEFETLVRSSPNYDYAYFMLGLSQFKMGRTDEARDNFAKAIAIKGDQFEYHSSLARVYFTTRDFALAVSVLNHAEPLAGTDPHEHALLSIRGQSYAALEEWALAAEDLERARALGPAEPSELFQLGQAYYKLGQYDRAVPVLREAVAAAPQDASSLLLLADSLIRLSALAASETEKAADYNEALRYAEQFQAQEPGSYEAHDLVGRAALGARDLAKAEAAFRAVLAQKPDHCYAQINLGKTHIAQERFTDAEAELRGAAICAPQMPEIHESLGFALQKQGRLQEAIESYRRAFDLEPSESLRNAIEICEEAASKATEQAEPRKKKD